jgi:hypothetical protein
MPGIPQMRNLWLTAINNRVGVLGALPPKGHLVDGNQFKAAMRAIAGETTPDDRMVAESAGERTKRHNDIVMALERLARDAGASDVHREPLAGYPNVVRGRADLEFRMAGGEALWLDVTVRAGERQRVTGGGVRNAQSAAEQGHMEKMKICASRYVVADSMVRVVPFATDSLGGMARGARSIVGRMRRDMAECVAGPAVRRFYAMVSAACLRCMGRCAREGFSGAHKVKEENKRVARAEAAVAEAAAAAGPGIRGLNRGDEEDDEMSEREGGDETHTVGAASEQNNSGPAGLVGHMRDRGGCVGFGRDGLEGRRGANRFSTRCAHATNTAKR